MAWKYTLGYRLFSARRSQRWSVSLPVNSFLEEDIEAPRNSLSNNT